MLSFLRKIRLGLLDEETSGDEKTTSINSRSTRRYLLYAIGEIALVVIGILIALQINAWSQERKDRQLEDEYIIRLKRELVQNKLAFESRIRFDKFAEENVGKILYALSDDSNDLSAEELVVAIEHIGWGLKFQYADDVWQELLNNGNIRLLQNDTLRDKTTAFNQSVRWIIELQGNWIEFTNGYRLLTGDILSPETRHKIAAEYGPATYNGEEYILPSKEYLISELRKLDGLNGLLADIKIGRNTNVAMIQSLVDMIDGLILLSDKELE